MPKPEGNQWGLAASRLDVKPFVKTSDSLKQESNSVERERERERDSWRASETGGEENE